MIFRGPQRVGIQTGGTISQPLVPSTNYSHIFPSKKKRFTNCHVWLARCSWLCDDCHPVVVEFLHPTLSLTPMPNVLRGGVDPLKNLNKWTQWSQGLSHLDPPLERSLRMMSGCWPGFRRHLQIDPDPTLWHGSQFLKRKKNNPPEVRMFLGL